MKKLNQNTASSFAATARHGAPRELDRTQLASAHGGSEVSQPIMLARSGVSEPILSPRSEISQPIL